MSSMVKRPIDPKNPGGAFFKPKREFGERDAKNWPVGRKTKMGRAGNRELNKLPPEITKVCEVRIPKICIGNRFLAWSHKWKRRFLVTAKDYLEAARSCEPCHTYCEDKMSHQKRAAVIQAAINRRKPIP